jgi:hypothetical protein
MIEAKQSVPRRRLARVRRVLASIGRALLADLCVGGLWTGGMMIDESMLRAFNEWTRQRRTDSPEPGTSAWLLPAPPAPSPERLIPEVPLSPSERVLWSDLLAADSQERSRRWLRLPR